MADGLFYVDTREPFIGAELPAVTLAATNKALYSPSHFPVLGGQYFSRFGKKLRIRVFYRITTGATPGNLTFGVYYGTGADANGVLLQSSAALTLIASQTAITGEIDVRVRCVTMGSAGTLFCGGNWTAGTAVIAAGRGQIPAASPASSAACDLTAALIISVQALRSGSTAETMQVYDLDVQAVN